MSNIKIPCINCIVYPMCKLRTDDLKIVLNLSGMFAYLKGHCDLLQEDYYEYKRQINKPDRRVLPYSQEPFCKHVLDHFKLNTSNTKIALDNNGNIKP